MVTLSRPQGEYKVLRQWTKTSETVFQDFFQTCSDGFAHWVQSG